MALRGRVEPLVTEHLVDEPVVAILQMRKAGTPVRMRRWIGIKVVAFSNKISSV